MRVGVCRASICCSVDGTGSARSSTMVKLREVLPENARRRDCYGRRGGGEMEVWGAFAFMCRCAGEAGMRTVGVV
jgi:hypothetical protein